MIYFIENMYHRYVGKINLDFSRDSSVEKWAGMGTEESKGLKEIFAGSDLG